VHGALSSWLSVSCQWPRCISYLVILLCVRVLSVSVCVSLLGRRVLLRQSGALYIRRAMPSDVGRYQCVAVNPLTLVERTSPITVRLRLTHRHHGLYTITQPILHLSSLPTFSISTVYVVAPSLTISPSLHKPSFNEICPGFCNHAADRLTVQSPN